MQFKFCISFMPKNTLKRLLLRLSGISRAAWLEPVTPALWDGQVENVILACQALAASCLKASQAANYFANNIERMRYDRFGRLAI